MQHQRGEELLLVLILDLGIRWGVSGQCQLYPQYPLDRRLGEPQSWSRQRLEEKSFASAGDQTPDIQSVVSILTVLPQLPSVMYIIHVICTAELIIMNWNRLCSCTTTYF
jgi:hypothetical protein